MFGMFNMNNKKKISSEVGNTVILNDDYMAVKIDKYGNKSDRYYIVDRNSDEYLSDKKFMSVFPFSEDAFATLLEETGDQKGWEVNRFYLDLMGNISDYRTTIGESFYQYLIGKITVFDLDEECFGDDKFLKQIMEHEQWALKYKIDNLSSLEDDYDKYLEYIKIQEEAEIVGDYVKAMAYAANETKLENERIKAEKTADKANRKEALDKQKAITQAKIREMF